MKTLPTEVYLYNSIMDLWEETLSILGYLGNLEEGVELGFSAQFHCFNKKGALTNDANDASIS